MRKNPLQYIFVLFTLFVISCSEKDHETSVPNTKALTHNDSLLLIIGNKNISDSLFACSAEALDSAVTEPASFWADKANDLTNDTFHKKIFVYNLLHRHIKDGMLLTDLPKITGKITWLKPENISIRRWLIRGSGWKLLGKIMDANGTCVEFNIFPDESAFRSPQDRFFRRVMRFRMGLDQKISKQNLIDFLLYNKKDSINDKIKIII